MQIINSYLQQIEEKVNQANQLYQDTNPATFSQNQALAKAEYLKQAKNLMTIAEKTQDNPEFVQAIKCKIQILIDLTKRCKVDKNAPVPVAMP